MAWIQFICCLIRLVWHHEYVEKCGHIGVVALSSAVILIRFFVALQNSFLTQFFNRVWQNWKDMQASAAGLKRPGV